MRSDPGDQPGNDGKNDKTPAQDRGHRLFKEAVSEALDDGLDCVRDRGVLDDLASKMGLDDADRDRIIEEVLSERADPVPLDDCKPETNGKPEKKATAEVAATASKASKKGRNTPSKQEPGPLEGLEEAREVIDELSCELAEARRKEHDLKKKIAELEVTNQELLARLGRVEVEPAPETASGDGQPPKDTLDAQEPQVTDEFWGPHTGLKRPHERPKTAPMTNRPADKPPRPKTLPMPPKDDEDLYLMKSIECSVCGTKNTIESKLKGNVEFVCRGCSKRSFVDIS